MNIPGSKRVQSSDLPTIDADVGTVLWIEDLGVKYEAVPRDRAATNAVAGPADALTPISWQPAGVIATVNGVSVAVSGTTFGDSKSPRAEAGELYLPRDLSRWYLECSQPCIEAHDPRIGVTVSAGAIDSVLDVSGNAATLTQTSTARPTVGVWASDGGAAFAFNGTDQWFWADGTLAHLQDTQSRTVLEYTRRARNTGSNCIHGGCGASGVLSALQVVDGNGDFFATTTGGNKNILTTGSPIVTTRDQLLMWVQADGAGNASLWVDGKQYVVADTFEPGTLTHTHLAFGALATAAATAANFTSGTNRWFGVYSGSMGVADYKLACRGLFGHPYANIICDGNSLTLGGSSTGGNTYPAYLAKAFQQTAGKCAVTNAGVGAQTTQQMIADFASEIVPLIRPGAHNIYVVWEVGNDILLNSLTPTEAVANYWTLVDLAVAAGFDVLAVTCGPRGDFDGTGALGSGGTSWKAPARLTEANALILAGASAHGCFAVANVGAAPQLQDTANRNYIVADTVHYTNAGYAVVSATVAKPLSRRLAEV
jgi:hypothetical protein